MGAEIPTALKTTDRLILGLIDITDIVNGILSNEDTILFMRAEQLELSVRGANVLKNSTPPIITLCDLVSCQKGYIAKQRGCGVKTLKDINERLADFGLFLGMDQSSIKCWKIDNYFKKNYENIVEIKTDKLIDCEQETELGQMIREFEDRIEERSEFEQEALRARAIGQVIGAFSDND